MDRQAVFNQVAKHLLTQMKRSQTVDFACCYRMDGLKCAIGALIPDDVYQRGMENKNVRHLVDLYPGALAHLGTITDMDVLFLQDLQNIHDERAPSLWRGELSRLAEARDLKMPEGV